MSCHRLKEKKKKKKWKNNLQKNLGSLKTDKH